MDQQTAVQPKAEELPVFSLHDFESSATPYVYVENKQGNLAKFQALTYVKKLAKEVGFTDFNKGYKAYRDDVKCLESVHADNLTEFSDAPMQLLCGQYECTDDGIARTIGRGGMTETRVVCAHPLLPVRRLVNLDSGEVKMELAYRRGGKWKTAIFDSLTLSSAQRITALSSVGMSVNSENAREIVTYLSEVADRNYDILPEVKSVSRLGWVRDNVFSPYVEGVAFDGENQFQHMFECIKTAGSEKVWKDFAMQIRATGTIPARISLAASLSSALVCKIGAHPYFVHMWGESGSGKTVALMLAASVWGAPSVGDYCQTFNATDNALEALANFCGALPVCLDELQIQKGGQGGNDKTVYRLSEGCGKSRMTKTGAMQKTSTWCNCIISTGESPINNASSGAGAINRVLDINCRDTALFEDPRSAAQLLKENYGFAGKALAQYLMLCNKAEIAKIKEEQTEIMQELQGRATEKQALAASIVLTADRLYGRLSKDDQHNLKTDDIAPFLATQTEVDSNKRAYDYLLDVVGSNPAKFMPRDMQGGGKEYAGEAWGCYDADSDDVVYIIVTQFRRILIEGSFNPDAFLDWTARNGILARVSTEGKAIKKRLPGQSKSQTAPRCYCIRTAKPDASVCAVVKIDDIYELPNRQMEAIGKCGGVPACSG